MSAVASGRNDHRGEIFYFAVKIDVSLRQLYFHKGFDTYYCKIFYKHKHTHFDMLLHFLWKSSPKIYTFLCQGIVD